MNTWDDRCAVMESDALSSQDAPLHHLCHTETAVMEKYTHLQYEDKSLLIQNSTVIEINDDMFLYKYAV